MKKVGIILAVVMILAMLMPAVASAQDPIETEYVDSVIKDSHKIKNKWDLSGTFVAHPGYNWDGMAEGATWTYKIHVKEAMNGDVSRGTIHFTTGDIDVVGHVKSTKPEYDYWSFADNLLAAVGTADYNDTTYYFMFLYAEKAIWFALSMTPYDSYWAGETVWGHALRAYQLHSKVPDETFLLDYKVIHE